LTAFAVGDGAAVTIRVYVDGSVLEEAVSNPDDGAMIITFIP
jgi:hypothetical protein